MPRRCALGCAPKLRGLLHVFPNPEKYPEQHKAWVKIITGGQETNIDFKKYRICDRHFTDKDRTRSSRLNVLAVPSLFLSDIQNMQPLEVSATISDSEMSTDCQDLTEISTYSLLRSESPSPGCSFSQLETINVTKAESTIPLPVNGIYSEHNYCVSIKSQVVRKHKAPKTEMPDCIRYNNLQRTIKNLRQEVYRLRKRNEVFKTRLKNAECLMNQPTVNAVVNKMSNPAKTFSTMQFTQSSKNKYGRRFTLDEKNLSLALYEKSPKCYSFMANLFTLPSTKSLKRLLSKISISPGTDNEILFDNLKQHVSQINTEDRLC